MGNGRSRGEDDTSSMPSSSDFARNFDMASPTETESYPVESEAESEYIDGDDDDYPDQEVPLLPGLYRAMFAFEPEGKSEMALVEDQIVRIVGRGGGVGWAVAEDGETGDMPMEPPAHAVHDTPAPIFAGAPGWKKDFCNNRREEAHSSLIHRHLYGRPYRELSGAYMVLRHLTRFGSHLGSGVSTQLCLHFKNEYDGAWAILLVNATY